MPQESVNFDLESVDPHASVRPPEEKKEEGTDKMSLLEQRLNAVERNRQPEPNPLLQQLLSDPDVAQVLQLKQQGKAFKITNGGDDASHPEPKMPEDTSDTKALVEYLKGTLVSEVSKMVQSSISPLTQRMDQIGSQMQMSQQTEAQRTIEAMRQKHSDFDLLVDDIKTLNNSYRGAVPLEDLYNLAKMKRGLGANRNTSTDTERPSAQTARPSRLSGKQYDSGNKGLMDMMDDALNGIIK